MLRALVTLVLTALLTASATAQVLDGTWYKLNVKSKGFVVTGGIPTDAAEGVPVVSLEKAKFKATAWMYVELLPEEGGDIGYMTTVVTEVAPGEYDLANIDGLTALTDELLIDGFLGFVTPDGAVGAEVVLQVKNKLDKEGALKNSKFTALGALVSLSALTPALEEGADLPYWGSMVIKGKSVSPNKLPFDAEEVLMEGMLLKSGLKTAPWMRETAVTR